MRPLSYRLAACLAGLILIGGDAFAQGGSGLPVEFQRAGAMRRQDPAASLRAIRNLLEADPGLAALRPRAEEGLQAAERQIHAGRTPEAQRTLAELRALISGTAWSPERAYAA